MKTYFYLSKKNINKKGLCPIVCRVAQGENREDFRTGIFVSPQDWDNVRGECKHNENSVNTRLSNIQNKVYRIIAQVEIQDNASPLDVIQLYKTPVAQHPKTIDELYTSLKTTNEITKDVNTVITASVNDFRTITKNITIQKVSLDTLQFFQMELKRKYKMYTVLKKLRSIKRLFMYADRNKFITSNPFANFIMPNLPKLSPIHLTEDEVKKIINRKFDSDRLNHVRDLFLMQCYTGLAFGDLFNFSRTMIEANGESLFIKGNRIKTENEFYLPFMKEAKQIAEKYDYNFRPISNQKFNEYLKEIAILCSIEKKISTHVGRKTFAQKMIDSGYTAESVSKMMGHASFTMTQKHYGRISQERIQKEVLKIAA